MAAQMRQQANRPTTQPPALPLIEQIAPTGSTANATPCRQPGACGLTDGRDPSLPSASDNNANPTLPREDPQSSRRADFPAMRSSNHPDTWMTARGRGKRRGTSSRPPRMTQTQLVQFRYCPPADTPVAGPSRITNVVSTTATVIEPAQDFSDLLHPSSNYFAPLTADRDDPPAEDTPADNAPADDPLPDTQALPPSSNPPLSPAPSPQSPVPSHPRDFPANLSPINDWDTPNFSLADSTIGNADDSKYNISIMSNA